MTHDYDSGKAQVIKVYKDVCNIWRHVRVNEYVDKKCDYDGTTLPTGYVPTLFEYMDSETYAIAVHG